DRRRLRTLLPAASRESRRQWSRYGARRPPRRPTLDERWRRDFDSRTGSRAPDVASGRADVIEAELEVSTGSGGWNDHGKKEFHSSAQTRGALDGQSRSM